MNFRIYPEKKYDNIIHNVPPKYYQVVESYESLAKEIYPSLEIPFIGACISTGDYTQVSLNFGNFEIPQGSRIAHLRLFREDRNISKAYDTIIFPIKSGAIISVPWKYADDHHRPILMAGGIEGIVNAHGLPDIKFGPVSEYTVNGAIIPVVVDFGEQEQEKLRKQNSNESNGHSPQKR
jgi:hypothetical protein